MDQEPEPELRLTWDTNCIITMESNMDRRAADRAALEELLTLHDAGRLEIRVPAAMASENQPNGQPPLQNFEELRARVAAAGLGRLMSVPSPPAPIAFDMAFFNEMAFDDGLLPQIFSVMFPGASFDGPRPGENEARWWGRRIDAAVYWGHINNGGDLFVTSDQRGFIRGGRRERLLELGGRGIETPVDAVGWVGNELS